jgi:hypothetical protein
MKLLVPAALLLASAAHAQYPLPYPPVLPGGKDVVTDTSPAFLKAPPDLRAGITVARTPPAIDFMFYPGQDHPGGPWTVWGKGSVVDGVYYSAIGDHLGPRGTAKIYRYDPPAKKLRELADVGKFLVSQGAIPAGMNYVPGKIHTRLMMGRDGWLYYGTHRGREETCDDRHGYRGDWILRTHPESGKTEMIAAQPVAKHSIPAGFIDPKRMIFYGGTSPGLDAPNQKGQFLAFDLLERKILKVADGGFIRNAIFSDSTGRVYWDAQMYDPGTNLITPSEAPEFVRSVTAETPQGIVYGTCALECNLWAFHVKSGRLEQLGFGAAGKETYTASMDADPTGRYLYYVPGAHGGTSKDGTPVLQFDTRTRRIKVIAFLDAFYFEKYGYHPDGTYSTVLDAQGATLYVTWNGMRRGHPGSWESCALMAIHIPESERPLQ